MGSVAQRPWCAEWREWKVKLLAAGYGDFIASFVSYNGPLREREGTIESVAADGDWYPLTDFFPLTGPIGAVHRS